MTEAQINKIKKYAGENSGITFYDKNGKTIQDKSFGDYRKIHKKLWDRVKKLWNKGKDFTAGIRG